MSASISAGQPVLLTSWKDIARYMGKGVRTVQRWEREFELPVRRPRGVASKSTVMANREDLDFWLASRWSRRSTQKPRAPSAPQPATPELTVAIRASQELRAANQALMWEVSSALRELVHNCDEIRQRETAADRDSGSRRRS
jgi:hypothetical protein